MDIIFFLLFLYAFGAIGAVKAVGKGARYGGRKIPLPPEHLRPKK